MSLLDGCGALLGRRGLVCLSRIFGGVLWSQMVKVGILKGLTLRTLGFSSMSEKLRISYAHLYFRIVSVVHGSIAARLGCLGLVMSSSEPLSGIEPLRFLLSRLKSSRSAPSNIFEVKNIK